jgi:hypothetical protein
MDKTELEQIASVLSGCHEAVCEWDGTRVCLQIDIPLWSACGWSHYQDPRLRVGDPFFECLL